MKKLLFIWIALLPMLSNAQAHLGSTEAEIKAFHTDKTFDTGYTDDGQKYISAYMTYGTFLYYFDKKTGLSSYCKQIVNDMPHFITGQIEIYNKQYEIISDTKWEAHLEGGGILTIELSYNDAYKSYVFEYTY